MSFVSIERIESALRTPRNSRRTQEIICIWIRRAKRLELKPVEGGFSFVGTGFVGNREHFEIGKLLRLALEEWDRKERRRLFWLWVRRRLIGGTLQ